MFLHFSSVWSSLGPVKCAVQFTEHKTKEEIVTLVCIMAKVTQVKQHVQRRKSNNNLKQRLEALAPVRHDHI